MDTNTIAPFPEDIPTHPLLVIDYELIKACDKEESDRLWSAATQLGFWYLKNHNADEEVGGMFDMAAETMALPMEDKMKYEQGDDGMSFGYRAAGASAIDEKGTRGTAEFINVAKDDALAWPAQARRCYPLTVNARMTSTIAPFVKKSLEISDTLLRVFNEKLQLPKGTLLDLHPREEYSGSEARCTFSPPILDRQVLSAHTGWLSIVHNRLGGLQVLPPGTEQWQYVKPIPGHVICNIGDALTILSGGILRSNMHRVVNPPGAQGKNYRFSLVYFARPQDSVVLRALVEDSPLIAGAIAKVADPNKFNQGVTAAEWFARRVKYTRIKNRKGPETWMVGRGMEDREHPTTRP
ncbi:hypothetical protein DFH07DRAFT_760243 [Mycena maculata]|uniref:Clavaminate synthase-like protein n=1 Tax=Mycena maculata TaxID=230809 RepID=A0AAD7HJ84_9AGAR|nr:hypothetical protein DFH07DRAFT_760243 [Mycena maculata]